MSTLQNCCRPMAHLYLKRERALYYTNWLASVILHY